MKITCVGTKLQRTFLAERIRVVQDRVPAFPVAKARAIFEAELGAPPEQLFATFNEQPLAAASLGQVQYYYII